MQRQRLNPNPPSPRGERAFCSGAAPATHPQHTNPHATAITRKHSSSTSAIIEANLDNDPVPHTAQLTVITVASVLPRRVNDHRDIGQHTVGSSTHGFRRIEAVNGAAAETNTPFDSSVASLGSVTPRLAGRPPGPRPLAPRAPRAPGRTAPGPQRCAARARPTTRARASVPVARDQAATTASRSTVGSTRSAVDSASASTPDVATTLTCRTPARAG